MPSLTIVEFGDNGAMSGSDIGGSNNTGLNTGNDTIDDIAGIIDWGLQVADTVLNWTGDSTKPVEQQIQNASDSIVSGSISKWISDNWLMLALAGGGLVFAFYLVGRK